MFGINRILKLALLIFTFAFLVVGDAALSGEWSKGRKAKKSRSYFSYGEHETIAMLDAINRDHPVKYAYLNGSNGVKNPYLQYGEHETMALIDALNRDHPVQYAPLNGSNGVKNPYLEYGEHETMALIDALNADAHKKTKQTGRRR